MWKGAHIRQSAGGGDLAYRISHLVSGWEGIPDTIPLPTGHRGCP